MKRPPADLPEKGDRCVLRGSNGAIHGVLRAYNTENEWSSVVWDKDSLPGPRLVHRHELQKVIAALEQAALT